MTEFAFLASDFINLLNHAKKTESAALSDLVVDAFGGG